MEAAKAHADKLRAKYDLQKVPLDADEIADVCRRGAALIDSTPLEIEPHDPHRVKQSTQPTGDVQCGIARCGDREWLIFWNLLSGTGLVALAKLDNGYPWSAVF